VLSENRVLVNSFTSVEGQNFRLTIVIALISIAVCAKIVVRRNIFGTD